MVPSAFWVKPLLKEISPSASLRVSLYLFAVSSTSPLVPCSFVRVAVVGSVVELSSVTRANANSLSSASRSRSDGMVDASATVVLLETAFAITSTVPPAVIFPVVVIEASLLEFTTVTAMAPTIWFAVLLVFASL